MVAVVVMAVSNDASEAVKDEISVASSPAGPTNVSAHMAAVVPVILQSNTTDVDSKDSSAWNVDGPTVTVIGPAKPQSTESASVGHAIAIVVFEESDLIIEPNSVCESAPGKKTLTTDDDCAATTPASASASPVFFMTAIIDCSFRWS